MNAQETTRRIEGIKMKYGDIIAANCGFSSSQSGGIPSIDVLDAAKDYFDPSGERKACYMDESRKAADGTLICKTDAPPVIKPGDLAGAIQRCIADKTLQASQPYLQQMGFYNKDFRLS